MSLQDAPVTIGAASLPPNAPAAVTPETQDPPPPASLVNVPLRRQRRRRVEPLEDSPLDSRVDDRVEARAEYRAQPAAVSGGAQAEVEQAMRAGAAPGNAGPEPAAQAAAAPDTPEPEGGDIVAFWKRLRGERRFPSWTDLRFERCAAHWPNSLLLRFPADDGSALPRIEAAFSDAMRAAAVRSDERSRIDHTPLMTDWLIALSQEAARAGRPIHDEQVLPSWRGPTRYRAVALPFSEDQAEIDHVLCHVAHA